MERGWRGAEEGFEKDLLPCLQLIEKVFQRSSEKVEIKILQICFPLSHISTTI